MHDTVEDRSQAPTVCIAENRASCEPALRILVASLTHLCPATPVILFCPEASLSFREWINTYRQCRLNPGELDGIWTKYDIKPLALLTALGMGVNDVIWIDSDMLVTRDFRNVIAALSPRTLVVAEEALGGGHADPDGLRARLWSLPVGRVLPIAANTGIVRVTPDHIALLKAWNNLLQSPSYREAQSRPWYAREVHLAGDQEVLTALLASEQFADIPIHFLRRGRDVVQFFGIFGYTLRERFTHLLRNPPYFIHSQGFRPWWPASSQPASLSERFGALYNALSPYTVGARRYADVLEDRSWLRPPTPLARLLSAPHPTLAGLPVALIVDAVRLKRAILSRRAKPPLANRNHHLRTAGDIMSQSATMQQSRMAAAIQSGGISSSAIYRAVLATAFHASPTPARILDFGSGTGQLLPLLADAYPHAEIHGADIVARPTHLPDAILWHQGDLNESKNAALQQFDLIVAVEVIEHLENPRQMLRDIARLLVPGGVAVLSTPNTGSLRSLITLAFRGHHAQFDDSNYPAHISPVSELDFRRIGEESGLHLESYFYTDEGVIPRMLSHRWQRLPLIGSRLNGRHFSDNFGAVFRKTSLAV